MTNIKRAEFKHFDWINIQQPDNESVRFLSENFNFHPLNIQECLLDTTRSKIDIYSTYTYFIHIFPVYIRSTREIKPIKISFFVGKKFLITLPRSPMSTFHEFFSIFEGNKILCENFREGSPEKLLYEILSNVLLYCYPMIDHLIKDCDNIQEQIFSGNERKMVSVIRRNITDFRKIMQGHKNVLKKLITFLKVNTQFVMKKDDIYFENLIDHTKEIWDTLCNLKERIEALQETNESQISYKLSDIMKMLTIISVITFPLTLIGTIFTMQLSGMPFQANPNGFWIVIIIMGTILTGMLTFFKKKGWM